LMPKIEQHEVGPEPVQVGEEEVSGLAPGSFSPLAGDHGLHGVVGAKETLERVRKHGADGFLVQADAAAMGQYAEPSAASSATELGLLGGQSRCAPLGAHPPIELCPPLGRPSYHLCAQGLPREGSSSAPSRRDSSSEKCSLRTLELRTAVLV